MKLKTLAKLTAIALIGTGANVTADDVEALQDPISRTGKLDIKLRNGAHTSVSYVDQEGLAIVEADMIMGRITAQDEVNFTGQGVAYNSVGKLWIDGVVPYRIDSSLTSTAKQRVLAGFAVWEASTSIRFVEISADNAAQYPDYVLIKDGSGCAAHVGRTGGSQLLMLSPQCSVGNAIHETGHALGLFHEHTRTDRDKYIDINYSAVKSGYEPNFEKVWYSSVGNVGGYDYESIMHYGRYAFSANGSPTITALDSSKNSQLGQRSRLSQGDINTINSLYATDLGVSVDYNPDLRKMTVAVANQDSFGANDLVLSFSGNTPISSIQGAGWTCDSNNTCNRNALLGERTSELEIFFDPSHAAGQLSVTIDSANNDLNRTDNQASVDLPSLGNAQSNSAPTLVSTGAITVEGSPYNGQILATLGANDPDGDVVSFRVVGGNVTSAIGISPATGQVFVKDASLVEKMIGANNYLEVVLEDAENTSQAYKVYFANTIYASDINVQTSGTYSTPSTSAATAFSGDSGAGGGALGLLGLSFIAGIASVGIRRKK